MYHLTPLGGNALQEDVACPGLILPWGSKTNKSSSPSVFWETQLMLWFVGWIIQMMEWTRSELEVEHSKKLFSLSVSFNQPARPQRQSHESSGKRCSGSCNRRQPMVISSEAHRPEGCPINATGCEGQGHFRDWVSFLRAWLSGKACWGGTGGAAGGRGESLYRCDVKTLRQVAETATGSDLGTGRGNPWACRCFSFHLPTWDTQIRYSGS